MSSSPILRFTSTCATGRGYRFDKSSWGNLPLMVRSSAIARRAQASHLASCSRVPRHDSRALCPAPRQPVPAPGRHHLVGADHRRAGEHDHTRVVRRLPDAGRARDGVPRRSGTPDPPDGFFRAKSRNLVGMATALVERYDGEVPTEMADLTTLARSRKKDGQCRAQRRVRLAGSARWTPMSAVWRAGSGSQLNRTP